MNCMVCQKHKNFEVVTGEPIVEIDGMVVSHFPIIENAKANKGHLLVESKRHVTHSDELTDSEAQALGLLLCKCITLLIKELGAEHAYVFRLNDKVAHFHFHVVPRFPNTPKEYWGHNITDWPEVPKLNHDEIRALSKKLKNRWNFETI